MNLPVLGNAIHRTFAKRVVSAVVAVGLTACGAELPTSPTPVVTPPTAGWLTVQLTTPRSDDGAVQLHVSGPSVDSVDVTGYPGFATVTNGAADLVVTGAIASGTVARIHVADPARASEYRGSVVAAAARGTFAVQDITNYRAALVR